MALFGCWRLNNFFGLSRRVWSILSPWSSVRFCPLGSLPVVFVIVDGLGHFLQLASKVHFIEVEDDSLLVRKVRLWFIVRAYTLWAIKVLDNSIVSNSNAVLSNWLYMRYWIYLILREHLFSWTFFLLFMILSVRTCMNTCRNLWINFALFIVVVPITHRVIGL